MLSPGTLVDWEWYTSEEGKRILNKFKRGDRYKRSFGCIERLAIIPTKNSPELYKYKIYLHGPSGVGKSCTISKLAGNPISEIYYETPGLQITSVFWPCRLRAVNKTILFHLELWDSGENVAKKFDHILPGCKENVDLVMFLFSFTGRTSFEDLPHAMVNFLGPEQGNVCKLVIGTKFDQFARSEISQNDVIKFQQDWNIHVLKISNVERVYDDPFEEVDEVAPMLNALCEHLWHRDEQLQGHSYQSTALTGPKTTQPVSPQQTKSALV